MSEPPSRVDHRCPAEGSPAPPRVKICVRVSDLKATLGRAEELGGRALVPLAEPPNDFGRFAVLADPDGNRSGCGREVSQEDGGSGSGLVPGAERAIDGGAVGAGRASAAGHAAPGRGGHRPGINRAVVTGLAPTSGPAPPDRALHVARGFDAELTGSV